MSDPQFRSPILRVVLIGDAGVGKSHLLSKYCDEVFSPEQIPTIGVDFRVKRMIIGEDEYKVQIWDTAGQERFRLTAQSYLHSAHGALICFSITDPVGFEHCKTWSRTYRELAGNKPTVLVGLKRDLQESRQVSAEEAELMAKEIGSLRYFEVSVFSPEQEPLIKQAFSILIENCVACSKKTVEAAPPTINLTSSFSSTSLSCCSRG